MAKEFFRGAKSSLWALALSTLLFSVGFGNLKETSPKEALILKQITEYWKDGDYKAVKLYIADFLTKNPTAGIRNHLHAILGDLHFQERNFAKALVSYQLIEDPSIQEKTFFNRLQSQFETKDYRSVIEFGEKALKTASPSEEMKVRYLIAEGYFRLALQAEQMEEKFSYLKQAKPQYKILTQTKYSERALFPLAEIHRLLKENDEATFLYLRLAEKYPDHRERFLFQAGILRINDKKKEAAEHFHQAYLVGGQRAKLAAFNRLVLLYQMGEFEKFLHFYADVGHLIPAARGHLLQFYAGRCHYSLGDHQQASSFFEEFIKGQQEPTKELKVACLLLVNSGNQLKDISLIEKTLAYYQKCFPMGAETPKIMMVHAHMCQENGNIPKALEDFQHIFTTYSKAQEAPTALYDYAFLQLHSGHWKKAREAFTNLIERYPLTEKKSAAWRHLVNASIEQLRSCQTQENSELLMHTLAKALDQPALFSLQEHEQYTIAMFRCAYAIGEYQKALDGLTPFLAQAKTPCHLANGHLLMAESLHALQGDSPLFIEHAERALSYNEPLEQTEALHLELYNAYLNRAASAPHLKEQTFFYEKAADHLFSSLAWKEGSIQRENHLWLIHHFYMRAKLAGALEAYDRAYILFSHLLGINEGDRLFQMSLSSLDLEPQVLKFAELLKNQKKGKEQIALLESFLKSQEAQPHIHWQFKRRALFELGHAYEMVGQHHNAIHIYEDLVNTKNVAVSSVITSRAELHLMNLRYQLLKPDKKVVDHPEIIAILHTLKEIQIQKRVETEPIHLEAALRYAEIRTDLASANGAFYYKRMQEDFHAVSDPLSEEYAKVRVTHPEKGAIFGAYMRYLDARMLLCLPSENQRREAALAIVHSLLENRESLKPYLLDRVERLKRELHPST